MTSLLYKKVKFDKKYDSRENESWEMISNNFTFPCLTYYQDSKFKI